MTYAHVPHNIGKKYEGPEAKDNRKFVGNKAVEKFTTLDATHVIISKKVKRALIREHLGHKWYRTPRLYPKLTPIHNMVTRLYSAVTRPYRKFKIHRLGG